MENDKQASKNDGASKGGVNRAKNLSPKQRTEIARKAATARWNGSDGDEVAAIPKAEWPGVLPIGDLQLPCAVLSDGRRVLSERGVTSVLGGKRGGSHWRRQKAAPDDAYVPVFISAPNLAPFAPASLRIALSTPILYRTTSGTIGYGVEAKLLPEVCDVWLKARRANALTPQQNHIADAAEILISGLAHVGIDALVDEATGFQSVRDRTELQRILEAYIRKEFLPWSKVFPDEFYQEMFRLRGWNYSPPQPNRPRLVGRLTNELIYDKLPPGVLEELRARNPVVRNGRRAYKHHRFLTDEIGQPHLEKQLVAVTTLMQAAKSWGAFKRMFDRVFPPTQPYLLRERDDDDDDDD
jgi:hypothetical protein